MENNYAIDDGLDDKSIKIKVPDEFLTSSSFDTLPDFSFLPDIPKLSIGRKIDRNTKIPSFKNRKSSTSKERYAISSVEEGKKSILQALKNSCSKQRSSHQVWGKTKVGHFGNQNLDNFNSDNLKPNLFWGNKRKAQPHELKSISRKSGYIKQPRSYKKRDFKEWKRLGTVKSVDCAKLAEPKFERKLTQNNLFLDYEIDEELKEIANHQVRFKRTHSVEYFWFSLCPPPPLNTTQYISGNIFKRIKLPKIVDWSSPENINDRDAYFDENSPDTHESMAGKNLVY